MPSVTTLYPTVHGGATTAINPTSVATQAAQDAQEAQAAAESAQSAAEAAAAGILVGSWSALLAICGTAGRTITLDPRISYVATSAATLAEGVQIIGNGATITSGYSSYVSSNDFFIITEKTGTKIDNVRFVCTRATLLDTLPPTAAFIRINRGTAATGIDPHIYANRQTVITGNVFIGGNRAISAQHLEDGLIENNTGHWQYEFGFVCNGYMKRTKVMKNTFTHTGITEGIRVGTNSGTPADWSEDNLICDNTCAWCGYLDPVTGFQEGFDLFLKAAANNVFSRNVAIGCGGGHCELKWTTPTNAYTYYKNVVINDNVCVNYFNSKGFSFRSSETSAPVGQLYRYSVKGNSVVSDPFSRSFSGASVSLAFTSGSKAVTATITAHGGSDKDWILITGLTEAVHTSLASYAQVHELLDQVYIGDITTNTFTFDVPTAATATGSVTLTGATVYCKFSARTLGSNAIATTNGSADIVVTDTNHGLTTSSYVTISGATTGNGIDATSLNRKFIVKSVTTDTYTLTVRQTASGTGNIGGAAISVTAEYGSGSAYWIGYVQQLNFSNNTASGGFRALLIDADNYSTTDPTIRNLVISNNQFSGQRYGIEFQTCTVDGCVITGNVITETLHYCLRIGIADSDFNNGAIENNIFMTNMHRAGDEALFMSAIRNSSFGGNKITAQGYGFRLYANSNGITVTGLKISGNRVDVSGTYGRDAFAIQDGTVTFGRNETLVPSSYRGISIPSGTPTITYGEQERGSSAATPTVAGGLGDTFIQSTPAGGADLKWICTTAGGSGAATWTKVY